MKRLTPICIVLAGLALLPGGCGKNQESSRAPAPKQLLLYCGAGIRMPAAELAEVFGKEHGVQVATDYAGSELLLSRLKLAKQGDLYMPGDQYYIDQAAKEGLILRQQPVCYLVPTILVQKGNPKNIAGLAALTRPGIKLGLGNAAATAIGRTSREIIEKNAIAWADLEKNLAFQSLTVNELGAQIQTGSLDAVIVWDAIARQYAEHGQEVPIPVDQNVVSTVSLGVVTWTKQRELAEQFIAFAASQRGRAIFAKHGYRVEPPGK